MKHRHIMRVLGIAVACLVTTACQQITGTRPLEKGSVTDCLNPLAAGDRYLEPHRDLLVYVTKDGSRFSNYFHQGHCVTYYDSLATRGVSAPPAIP